MHQRRSLPMDSGWSLTRDYDPFCAADMADLVTAAWPRAAGPQGDPAELARWLSNAALTFMLARRVGRPIPASEIDKRMTAFIEGADDLLELTGGDILDWFDPDIGHSEPVRHAMGVPPVTSGADWPAQKDAARVAKRVLSEDLPDCLRLLRAAATHQRAVVRGRSRSGRTADQTRHELVVGVLRIYEAATGKTPGVTKPPDGSRRGGPAARFLAAACARLRLRLTAEERQADPSLEGDLAAAEAEEVAGAWVEAAREWKKALRQAGTQSEELHPSR